ncbi:MAG: DUF3048 domain-containing protein [Oscillospiraceae bacterium]|nr:DUF3048 domain-containing protein [Oscillospiraceae bacterium]
MKKNTFAITATLITLSLALTGCSKPANIAGGDNSDTYNLLNSTVTSSATASETTSGAFNPLTGLYDLRESAQNARPTAVMVNNIAIAQTVQTGLQDADIVYETYAEGGITRLMAVYKDISVAEKIGTIRSARYSYVELASGHDAIYVHAGTDPSYCKPFMTKLKMDDFDLNGGAPANYGRRESNGLASEHTLYTSGAELAKGYKDLKRNTKVDSDHSGNWQSFNKVDSPTVPSEGSASKLSVFMSKSYVSGFNYDTQAGMYNKTQNGSAHKDYATGKQISFKNVLVLFAKVTPFADNYHVKTELTSGTGYYVSQGGYETVNWSKNGTYGSIKLTTSSGGTVDYNAGTSWVCFVDKNNKNQVSFS